MGVSTRVLADVPPLPYCAARAATSSRQKEGMIRDDVVPDRVGSGRETLKSVSDGLLGRSQKLPLSGWCGRWCSPRGSEVQVAPTPDARRAESLCTSPECCGQRSAA